VGLYVSRVVLRILGVEDYGILGLVGGIVSMFGFLNVSMEGATSRFITYDLGLNNNESLKHTFNAAFQSHLIIAFIVVIFAETLGLWFVNTQLDIPHERFFAANCIYQLSILSAVIAITQVPYSAVILAHEQMDVYAWFEILNAFLKLFIVWLLQLAPYDKLIFYGILSFAVTVLIRTFYRIYCYRNYPESHLCLAWNPKILRKMFSFTGWNLYADASVTIRQQGVNILINRFFGVALNAACSIAAIVQGTVWTCGYYVLAAFRPQITKQYAKKNIVLMQQMMSNSLRFTLLFFLLVSVPAILCMPTLMRLWLGNVPEYAIIIAQILLIDNLFGLINHTFYIGLQSQGDIRKFSILNGTLKLLCLPCIFLLLRVAAHPAIPFAFNVVVLIAITYLNLRLLKGKIPQLDLKVLLWPMSLVFFLGVVCLFIVLPLHFYLKEGLLHFSSVSFTYIVLLTLGSYYLLFDKKERLILSQMLPWNHRLV
jgi:O-antigen/teichoic acid export membrane protein